jgi:hypothetical protein
MHGFASPVGIYLGLCTTAVNSRELKHHTLIPVLWPSLPDSQNSIGFDLKLVQAIFKEVQDEGAVGAANAFAGLTFIKMFKIMVQWEQPKGLREPK